MKIIRKSFYMVRHGQTTDNALGLVSGCGSDPDLTDKGRAQAEQVRQVCELMDPKPGEIIVTGLKRTHQTAEIVVGHRRFTIEPGLNERSLGEGDGKMTEADQKAGKLSPGEESHQHHADRVMEALNRRLAATESAPPLFVTHSGTIRRVLEAITGTQKRVEIGNAQIYQFVPIRQDRWKIFELSVVNGKLQRKELTFSPATGKEQSRH